MNTYIQELIKGFQKFLDDISTRTRLRIFKTALAAFLLLISTYYLSYQYFDQPINVKIGDITNFDIRVPYDVTYVKSVETQRERERARNSILKVYDRDQSIMKSGLDNIKLLFDNIEIINRKLNDAENQSLTDSINELKQKIPNFFNLGRGTLRTLVIYNSSFLLQEKTNNLFISLMDRPVLVSQEEVTNPEENVVVRTINALEEIPETTGSLKDLSDLADLEKNIYKMAREKFPTLTRNKLLAIIEVVTRFLRPNCFYNEAETIRRKEEAAKTTKPITGLLKKSQIIVRYGEPMTRAQYDLVSIMNRYRTKVNVGKIIGLLLIQLVLGALFVNFFYRYTMVKFKYAKNIAIVSLLLFFMITMIFLISRIEGAFGHDQIFALFIPITFMTLTLSILFDEKVAIGCGIYIAIYIFLISNNEDIKSLYLALVTAMLGSYSVGRVSKRTDFLKIGFYIALSNIVIIFITVLYQGLDASIFLKLSGIGFLNGIISSIFAFGLIPVLESLFDVTTNFKLLELTDLNSPLLKMMLFKAPGTYQHSIAVASLAESACQEIGANSLLAKVGMYYHDIGKTKRPELFIENQHPGSQNPHNSLTPLESSKYIIDHVKYGLELVDNNHLPKIIREFITGHHGRTVIKYFYHKALEMEKDPTRLNRENFIYPGPNPKSKETGIAMLADSIEAASRVMDIPITVPKIRSLVKKITANKVNEGLLDDCELTLNDLRIAQDAFVSVLTGIYHSRIKYPDEKETQNLENKVIAENQNPPDNPKPENSPRLRASKKKANI